MEKVAIITSGIFPVPPTKGGAVENLVQNIINENEKNKVIDLCVFTIGNKKAEKISNSYKNTTFNFINVPVIIEWLNIIVYFFFAKLLRKQKKMSYRFIAQRLFYIFRVAIVLRKENFDKIVLENHTTLYLCLKLFKNYEKYNGKYIYHMHNTIANYYGCKTIIENTSEIIGVSEYILQTFKQSVPNFSKKMKFVVLRNQIDSTVFRKKYSYDEIIKQKNELHIFNNKKVVLFTGRMTSEKGIDKLLIAWNKANISDAYLVIVGAYYYNSGIKNNNYSKKLNKLINQTNNLIFTGYLNYSAIPKIYAIADLVVLPSVWEDPAPLTVIESLTSGSPLITTNSGGVPEYVSKSTIVLDKKNKDFVDNLSKEIKEILNDRQRLEKMSQDAYKHTQNWNTYNYYKNFIDLINK